MKHTQPVNTHTTGVLVGPQRKTILNMMMRLILSLASAAANICWKELLQSFRPSYPDPMLITCSQQPQLAATQSSWLRRKEKLGGDVPETCDEFMKVEPSSLGPSAVCVRALKWVLCVSHGLDDSLFFPQWWLLCKRGHQAYQH